MKLLLRENISNLGIIGDVVDVKPGYARNYLIPQGKATAPTEANIKAVEADKARYLEQLAEQRKELEIRAKAVDGKEITISSRANEEGHLYGSIGPAQIAAALAEEKVFVNAQEIVLPEPIRQLDKYDVEIRFAENVQATIHVWVVPIRDEEAAIAAEAGLPVGDANVPPTEQGDTDADETAPPAEEQPAEKTE